MLLFSQCIFHEIFITYAFIPPCFCLIFHIVLISLHHLHKFVSYCVFFFLFALFSSHCLFYMTCVFTLYLSDYIFSVISVTSLDLVPSFIVFVIVFIVLHLFDHFHIIVSEDSHDCSGPRVSNTSTEHLFIFLVK